MVARRMPLGVLQAGENGSTSIPCALPYGPKSRVFAGQVRKRFSGGRSLQMPTSFSALFRSGESADRSHAPLDLSVQSVRARWSSRCTFQWAFRLAIEGGTGLEPERRILAASGACPPSARMGAALSVFPRARLPDRLQREVVTTAWLGRSRGSAPYADIGVTRKGFAI